MKLHRAPYVTPPEDGNPPPRVPRPALFERLAWVLLGWTIVSLLRVLL